MLNVPSMLLDGKGALDEHLDLHTAPELSLYVSLHLSLSLLSQSVFPSPCLSHLKVLRNLRHYLREQKPNKLSI